MDNNNNKTKIRTMNAILGHPKLSKTFSDAIKAPIGSTKRSQAASIVKVMSKVYDRQDQGGDGMGGPGDPALPAFDFSGTQSMPGSTSPTSKIIIPAAPEPWTPGALSAGGSVQQGATTAASYAVPLMGAAGAGVVGLAEQGMSNFGKLYENTAIGAKNALFGYNPNDPGYQPYTSFSDTTGGKLASNIMGMYPSASMDNGSAPVHAVEQGNGSQQAAGTPETTWSQMANDPKNGQVTDQPLSTEQQTGATKADGSPSDWTPVGNPGKTGSTSDYSMSGDIGSNMNGGSTGGDTLDQAAANAVKNNEGPATFAFKAMQDKNLLKQLYPGVPDDQLPMGASLTDQMDKLQHSLKLDYHIDDLQAELAQKINAGVSLPNDITAYIKSKDQQVGHLDDMLNDVQNKLPEMDLGNPTTAAEMRNYQNYLLIMKGRANQRYVDFANQSITQFNAQTTAIQNQYNTAADLYKNDFQTKGQATQEQYNRTYTMLTDLYNNISAAPDKQAQRDLLDTQLTAARLSIISTQRQLDAANVAVGTGGAAGTGTAGALNSGMFTADDYMKAYKFVTDQLWDTKTDSMAKGAPSLKFLLDQNDGLPKTAKIYAYADALGKKLTSVTDPTQIASIEKELGMVFNDPTVQSFMQQNPNSPFSAMQNELAGKISGSVQRSIQDNAQKYRDALMDLIPKSGSFLGMGGSRKALADKQTWIKSHPDLPSNILGQLYDKIAADYRVQSANAKSNSGVNPIVDIIYNKGYTPYDKSDGSAIPAWINMTDDQLASTLASRIYGQQY